MPDALTINRVSSDIIIGRPHNVILFNDNDHFMQEVVIQIDKAIHCGLGIATALMIEAHKTGRAIIFTGWLEKCEHVAGILEEIRLGCKIEPV